MSGNNYSFSSGKNTGLTFSDFSNDDVSQPVRPKTPARMAGDVFAEESSSSNTENSSKTSTTGNWWRNQYSDKEENSGGSSSSSNNSSVQSQATDNKQSNISSPVTYDEDKYRYYDSEFGSGTGAEAYAKDMENYQSWVERNQSGPTAGHLGLVAEMMHPDWGRSQKTGGGNPIVEQDYSTAPNYAAGSKAQARFENKFGGSSSSSSKSKY